MNFLAIALGGATGSIVRYLLTVLLLPVLPAVSKGTYFWGTLLVNGLGCGLAGVMLSLKVKYEISDPLWNGISFGVLGGLTTFSTFTADTFKLFLQGEVGAGLMNVGLNLFICFAFIVLGYFLTQFFLSK